MGGETRRRSRSRTATSGLWCNAARARRLAAGPGGTNPTAGAPRGPDTNSSTTTMPTGVRLTPNRPAHTTQGFRPRVVAIYAAGEATPTRRAEVERVARPGELRAMTRRRLEIKDLERATGVGRETILFRIREGLLPDHGAAATTWRGTTRRSSAHRGDQGAAAHALPAAAGHQGVPGGLLGVYPLTVVVLER